MNSTVKSLCDIILDKINDSSFHTEDAIILQIPYTLPIINISIFESYTLRLITCRDKSSSSLKEKCIQDALKESGLERQVKISLGYVTPPSRSSTGLNYYLGYCILNSISGVFVVKESNGLNVYKINDDHEELVQYLNNSK